MKTYALVLPLGLAAALMMSACGEDRPASVPFDAPWSTRIAESFLLRNPEGVTYDSLPAGRKWNYEQGLMLLAMDAMYRHTGERRYIEFVRKDLDLYVRDDGSIATYRRTEYNIDQVGPGRALLAVYNRTRLPKFRFAADTLRQQMREHPRTNEGGFWHKKIYPYQMWLDGLFMAQPFLTQYARMYREPDTFDDIVNQFVWIERHTRDPKTDLLYHGWDESRTQSWANPATGCSPNFWGRGMGWYAMALVDVLELLPEGHPRRGELLRILQDLSRSLLSFRDTSSGLWYQVVDAGGRKGNYLEASASAMFAYAFAKGANRAYLGKEYLTRAEETFAGLIATLVTVQENGFVDLRETCRGAGLGGTPYRDGSYEYYISEPRRTNDMKGYGPFLLAAIEIEKGKVGKGQ